MSISQGKRDYMFCKMESLEGRRLLSAGAMSAPVSHTAHHAAVVAHPSTITALQNLVGAYSGGASVNLHVVQIYLQINRQTATTVKGYVDIAGTVYPGSVTLKNLGGQMFNLTYKTKGFSGTLAARLRHSQISGDFTFKIAGQSDVTGAFVLTKTTPRAA
jgi:hypothetical protein